MQCKVHSVARYLSMLCSRVQFIMFLSVKWCKCTLAECLSLCFTQLHHKGRIHGIHDNRRWFVATVACHWLRSYLCCQTWLWSAFSCVLCWWDGHWLSFQVSPRFLSLALLLLLSCVWLSDLFAIYAHHRIGWIPRHRPRKMIWVIWSKTLYVPKHHSCCCLVMLSPLMFWRV